MRDKSSDAETRVFFTPKVLPPYLKRTEAIEELIPWLYLKGVSTGDFSEALQALVGEQAKGLSANVVVRLKFTTDHRVFRPMSQILSQNQSQSMEFCVNCGIVCRTESRVL